MAVIITDGLVLRRTDYGDYDRMITLLTPEHGRIEAVVRGCKKPRSPLINAAEPFCAGEYQLYCGKDRYTVEQCRITDVFYDIRTDYEKLTHGMYWLSLLDTAAVPDVPARQLFLTALRALTFLNYSDLPDALLTMAFEMHFMALMGMRPMMHRCVRCGRPVDGDARFDLEDGGAVCALHQVYPLRGADMPLVHNGARRIIMKLPGTDFDKVELLRDNTDWPEAARIFRQYMHIKLERRGNIAEPALP